MKLCVTQLRKVLTELIIQFTENNLYRRKEDAEMTSLLRNVRVITIVISIKAPPSLCKREKA